MVHPSMQQTDSHTTHFHTVKEVRNIRRAACLGPLFLYFTITPPIMRKCQNSTPTLFQNPLSVQRKSFQMSQDELKAENGCNCQVVLPTQSAINQSVSQSPGTRDVLGLVYELVLQHPTLFFPPKEREREYRRGTLSN